MKTPPQFRPQVEQFEGRIVPSATVGASPAPAGLHGNFPLSPLALIVQAHHHQDVVFHGEVDGSWTPVQGIADVGATQALQGAGTVAPLGMAQATGTLHMPGFIRQGYTTGTIVLTSSQGSVTVALLGHKAQPGFSPPPSAFDYTITGGTGAYAGASGRGTATLTETPPDQTGAGKFTMTFNGILSMPSQVHAVSGIQGVALAGPISPVSLPGRPNEQPLPGAIITVQPANGGPEITRVTADPTGRFKIDLAPGTYLLVPLPPKAGALWPRGTPETVVVKANGYTSVVVNYDTGIR